MAIRIKKKGIHKRLYPLVKTTGGYDREYHIIKIAKETNQPVEIITELADESLGSKIGTYVDWLYEGKDIEDVFEIMKEDNKKARKENRILLQSMMMVNSRLQNSIDKIEGMI